MALNIRDEAVHRDARGRDGGWPQCRHDLGGGARGAGSTRLDRAPGGPRGTLRRSRLAGVIIDASDVLAISLLEPEAHAFCRGLNSGACFAYALVKETGLPLLLEGNGFSRTDIRPAVQPPSQPISSAGGRRP